MKKNIYTIAIIIIAIVANILPVIMPFALGLSASMPMVVSAVMFATKLEDMKEQEQERA